MRPPSVAGIFYAEDAPSLARQIAGCFERAIGRVPTVAATRQGRVRAILVPHAGLRYSGAVAAHAYAALAEDGLPETFVLIGPDHHAGGSAAVNASSEDWRTPMGTARTDGELLQSILALETVVVDESAHVAEHSLEVQLPFLQFLVGAGREVRFVAVAITLQDEEAVRELAQTLAKAAGGRDVAIVATSDLSHIGPGFGVYPPRDASLAAWATRRDEPALALIEAGEGLKALDYVRSYDLGWCGAAPWAAALRAANAMGGGTVRRLARATSHDVEPGRDCVGYASFAVG
ncbi:MAG TPA: AmmeMemoRadiSam system protein B [Candidatus Thermoplasmatota archaeon]|nr:AmmeMemoRadiSam system protein B [Candidatus Thermoplasmatota archaeon]